LPPRSCWCQLAECSRAGCETWCRIHLGEDLAAYPIAGNAAVTEQQGRVGRDHERRVGDDEVERFAGHGLEVAALTALDVVDAVEPGVELREPDRERVDVGGDHAARVPRCEEALEAAATAKVEGEVDRPPEREAGEVDGRARDAHHMVALDRLEVWHAAAGEEEVGVRRDPDRTFDLSTRCFTNHAKVLGAVERKRREGPCRLVARRGEREDEEPDECRQGFAGRQLALEQDRLRGVRLKVLAFGAQHFADPSGLVARRP